MNELDKVRARIYEMGCEASRLGHYDRAQGLYQACLTLDEARLRQPAERSLTPDVPR